MISTGIVRRIDEVGRVVLPIELRRTMELKENDALEIFVEDNVIMLKKYEPACIFCGSIRDLQIFKGKNVCGNCRMSIALTE